MSVLKWTNLHSEVEALKDLISRTDDPDRIRGQYHWSYSTFFLPLWVVTLGMLSPHRAAGATEWETSWSYLPECKHADQRLPNRWAHWFKSPQIIGRHVTTDFIERWTTHNTIFPWWSAAVYVLNSSWVESCALFPPSLTCNHNKSASLLSLLWPVIKIIELQREVEELQRQSSDALLSQSSLANRKYPWRSWSWAACNVASLGYWNVF